MSVTVKITRGDNPYAHEVQGKANEPITVAALLDTARIKLSKLGLDTDCLKNASLETIYDRLNENAPRIAIIGGSVDHPAHIVDPDTTAYAAARIWSKGGVPFAFSVPVLCDGTAQSNTGMCYSLESRNMITKAVVNQMEAHSYHGAFVIQGCDKQPLAIVGALAMLDIVRRARGDAPVFATFAPAHVLRGGTIPDQLRHKLNKVAGIAEDSGYVEIAEDLREALSYILQCSSNTSFQGVLKRASEVGIITSDEHSYFEKHLAVNTCDSKGGICAFNGTGNSSRHVISALGLVHPSLELLTEPALPNNINPAVDALISICNDPDFSVSQLVRKNLEMAVRVHSATGGSTNIMLHIVAVAISAGLKFDVWEYDRIRREHPVPDIFNYSLTEGRDIFALASQCCSGEIRGMETAIYELNRLGVPVPLESPTITGSTWHERLSDTTNLPAEGVKDNPILLSTPRRSVSGIDVISSNWFESAVVKISGMSDAQINEFDEHVSAVVYFETEEDANESLLDTRFLDKVRDRQLISHPMLLSMRDYHVAINSKLPLDKENGNRQPNVNKLASNELPSPHKMVYTELFDLMVAERSLRLAIVIAGQGPEAFGMPEMFTPMNHINTNRVLRRLSVLLSDGRYSGVTYGAAIGHITPEALRGGAISHLRDGDLLLLGLRNRRIDWLDPNSFVKGQIKALDQDSLNSVAIDRKNLIETRHAKLKRRQRIIAPSNRLTNVTDAAHGVVPLEFLDLVDY